MDTKKQQELAEQISEVYDRLQRLTMAVTPDNAAIMSEAYGVLRYVYQALVGEEKPEGADGGDV